MTRSAAIDRLTDEMVSLASNRILALRLSQIQYVLDRLPVGILVLDTNGVVTSANASAAPLLNIPPGESVGKQLSEISASDEFTEYVDGLLRRSAEVAEREIALAPDGKRDAATHRLHCEHLENEDLATVGLLVTLTDQRHVNVVRRSQHDFVDHLVHELRTPMTSIQASAEMMIDDENTDLDSRREIANIIYQETYRLSRLVDNLLNLSMMESDNLVINEKPTRLKRVLEETLDVVQPQADAKGVFINNELGDRLPSLNVDKSLFSMAVMNIIGNAVKYTPAGGTVTLSADYDEMSFKIAVRDTGIGIPEEYHDKIFDKFFRVVSASDGFHGSGVGLATAREIVRLHDGDITVTSTAGAGSTFVISLPRTRINSTVGD